LDETVKWGRGGKYVGTRPTNNRKFNTLGKEEVRKKAGAPKENCKTLWRGAGQGCGGGERNRGGH